MSTIKTGLVGIGNLGTAMMKHWTGSSPSRNIGVYHPDMSKAKRFINEFSNGTLLTKEQFPKLDVLILALPATQIKTFLQEAKDLLAQTLCINMATSINTTELRETFPKIRLIGIKMMGHANDLYEHGNGLFIAEEKLPVNVKSLFDELGSIQIDDEGIVNQVNKLATYHAVKAAKEMEKAFDKEGLPPEYIERALQSIAPEVIRAYSQGKLGHFGKEVANSFDYEGKK